MTNCGRSRFDEWLPNVPATPSNPRRWSTRPISGSEAQRDLTLPTARISLAPPPKQCAGSLSTAPAATVSSNAAATRNDDVDGDGVPQKFPLWRGSGTLISPSVVVTAGHVVGFSPDFGIAPTSMAVYFESDVRGTGYPFTGGHSGAPIPHPEFNGFLTLPNTHDIGVVVLDEPVVMAEYGQLPALGVLDGLATQRGRQDTTFDVVGFGVQYIRQSPKGIIKMEADPVRYLDLGRRACNRV